MATFTDSKGQEWSLALDAPLVSRVQEATGVNLGDLRADPMMELSFNPVLLWRVLFLLCETQAKAESISNVQFGERLAPVVSQAVDALEAAITDFFPSSQRSLLQSLRKQGQTMKETATTKAMQRITENQERIGQAIANKALRELEQFIEDSDSPLSESGTSAT